MKFMKEREAHKNVPFVKRQPICSLLQWALHVVYSMQRVHSHFFAF